MSANLWNALFFVITLGLLVTIHEFGHFWVARRVGVRVLRFAVGFGPALWRRTAADGTEYVVGSIPLGGYVKMLDEHEAPVPEAELSQAFNRQKLSHRLAIFAAGPLFNFLFAIAAFWLMFMLGQVDVKPILGGVKAETVAARAGFVRDMEIISVADAPVKSWSEFGMAIIEHLGDSQSLSVHTKDAQGEHSLTIPASALQQNNPQASFLTEMGFLFAGGAPVLAELTPDLPAANAGLKTGDRIISLDDMAIASWGQFVEKVQSKPGETVKLSVRRDASTFSLVLTLASKISDDGRTIGSFGATGGRLDESMLVRVRYGPVQALKHGIEETYNSLRLTVGGIAKLIQGKMSLKTLSGPIAIAETAGGSASGGLVYFVAFLGFLSVNLGLVNLLPIPMLDGGHLLFGLIEGVRGRPLSEHVQEIGMRIGLGFVGMLMSIALYNDIARHF